MVFGRNRNLQNGKVFWICVESQEGGVGDGDDDDDGNVNGRGGIMGDDDLS